jgi:diguanylate cyclase (GGDEF)-like protein
MSEPRRDVLLVDDDPLFLEDLARLLAESGYSARTACDGQTALERAAESCPDFVVTDWQMPRMDGLELCRRLRGQNLEKYVYIVVLGGAPARQDAVSALEAGADDFVIKPVAKADLLARFRSGERILDLERRLRRLARIDVLTGLPTRHTFFDELSREFERARRHRHPLSCVLFDVDLFKRINDTYGHSAGDEAIKTVARLLAANCRTSDLLCRYGGDEFCAVLPETASQGAMAWTARVRESLAAQPLCFEGKTLRLNVSAGLAQQHEDMDSPERLIDCADQALLVAKNSGRDRIVRFEALADPCDLDAGASQARGDPLHGVRAADCMTSPVATLRREQSIAEAAEFFCRLRVNSAPVVDSAGKLVGILSEKDLLAAVPAQDAWSKSVRELMQANVVSYEKDTPIRQIHAFLCRVSIRRVIIVDDGMPIGIIDRASLLRWFHNWLCASGRQRPVDPAGRSSTQGRPYEETVAEAAAALAAEAEKLKVSVAAKPEDLVPVVVGRASRMQDLLNDLLAYSRMSQHAERNGAEHLQL